MFRPAVLVFLSPRRPPTYAGVDASACAFAAIACVQGESFLFGKPVWNKRWFVLDKAGRLRYYANENSTVEKVRGVVVGGALGPASCPPYFAIAGPAHTRSRVCLRLPPCACPRMLLHRCLPVAAVVTLHLAGCVRGAHGVRAAPGDGARGPGELL